MYVCVAVCVSVYVVCVCVCVCVCDECVCVCHSVCVCRVGEVTRMLLKGQLSHRCTKVHGTLCPILAIVDTISTNICSLPMEWFQYQVH